MVRKGIRAVDGGQEPDCVRGAPGRVISTYCSDSVVRVPRRAGRNDEIILRNVGRAVARIAVDEDHGANRDRLSGVAQQIAALSEPQIATAAE
jgi:stringent starvation protein B